MSHQRILVAHPLLSPPGGGSGLAAWVLQTLGEDYDVHLACLSEPDFSGLNVYFGTSLARHDFTLHIYPESRLKLLNSLPVPGGNLLYAILERYVRQISAKQQWDLYFSTSNEFAFPEPGLQYVHWPRMKTQRPGGDYRWYHRFPGLLRAYRKTCQMIGGESATRLKKNKTMCNSSFTADAFAETLEASAEVVFPPVVGEFRVLPWANRCNQIVSIGRIHREKSVNRTIRILVELKEKHPAIQLQIVGAADCDEAYFEEFQQLLNEHTDWVTWHSNMPRAEMIELIENSRYGIHGMENEHFGMAVAELQRAGCVTFVHNSGGPVEIVGERSEQLYRDEQEAVAKIDAVLSSEELQADLHQHACSRRELFSLKRFQSEIRSAVQQMLTD